MCYISHKCYIANFEFHRLIFLTKRVDNSIEFLILTMLICFRHDEDSYLLKITTYVGCTKLIQC